MLRCFGGEGGGRLPLCPPTFKPLLQRDPRLAGRTNGGAEAAASHPHQLSWLLEGALGAGGSSGGTGGIPASMLLTGGGGGGSRGSACALALRSAIALLDATCELLIPAAFLALPIPQRAEALDAAAAPSGNAAKRLLAAHGAGKGTPLLPLSGTSIPAPCASEVLDPLLGAVALLLARATPPAALSAAKPVPPPPLLAALTRVLKRACASRDAVTALRYPLRLHEASGAPAALRMQAPLLEEVSGVGKGGMRNRAATVSAEEEAAKAREEVRKLQRQAKREARGAARELKLDRQFVTREADRAAAARDAERSATTKSLMAELQSLQHTFNQQVGKSHNKPLMKDDPARLPAHLAFVGKTKAQRREIKEGGGGGSGDRRKKVSSKGGLLVGGEGGKKVRREAKGPHHD